MAYLAGYQHDVFLSYAHVDEADPLNPERGWVSLFDKHLRFALDKRVGKLGAVDVWRDTRRLEGHTLFDQTIETAVNSSAIFVALTSNGYLNSDYCRNELACFHQKASQESAGLAVDGRMRILNVLLTNVPISDWPEQYGRTLGFTMHDAESDDQIGEPSDPLGAQYRKQLRKLADGIYALLEALARRSPTTSVGVQQQSTCRVYLADVPDSLWKTRNRLVEELRGQGIQVVSEVPPPPETQSEHDACVKEILSDVDLSVHLLGGSPGREIEGAEGVSYPQRQVELALKSGKKPLIWVPRNLNVEALDDDTHREFLRGLEHGERHGDSFEFVRSEPNEFSRIVIERSSRSRREEQALVDASLPCLLSTHENDTYHLIRVASLLADKCRPIYFDQYFNEPKDKLLSFEERVRKVATLIVIFGSVSRDWVKERIDAAVKIAALEGLALKLAVYLAPPRKFPEDLSFDRGHVNVHLFDNTAEFRPGPILAFFDQMAHGAPS